MRKLWIVGWLFLVLAVAVPAQHPAVVVSAPAVAARPVAAGASVPGGHALAGHPSAVAHPVRQGTSTNVKPAVARRRTPATLASRPIAPPPLGGFVNPVTAGTTTCNRHGSLPGLNACTPPGVVLPFFAGGVYVPIPYYADSGVPQEEQTNGQEEARNQPVDANALEPEPGSPFAPATRSNGSNVINESLAEFVFVERDGSRLYAVAYSFQNDKLHYVTKEGTRRSVALDLLDFDATQKLNEDLGNTVNLPNPPASGVALNVRPLALEQEK